VQLSGVIDPSRLAGIRLLTGTTVPASAPAAALFTVSVEVLPSATASTNVSAPAPPVRRS
jgi:hypothetical protein